MRKIITTMLVLLKTAGYILAAASTNDPFNAVVKINAVYCTPNFKRPWVKKPQYQGSGTGVVIGGNRILTNAHNVADSICLTVIKQNEGNSVIAKVESIDHQCDLAILSVEDKSFFANITPFELGETPPVQTQVFAVGYPLGGDGLSITQGIISRIEVMRYSHSLTDSLLAAQIDAALNPGNSGGPIIYDGKLVGIAFQGAGNGLGYMIHSEIIQHFLKDLEDGNVDGFGDLQASMMSLENLDTRNSLKMKEGQSGVFLYDVPKIPNIERDLQDEDVILSIDDNKIMNNGNILTREGTNRFFTTLIHSKQMGESVKLKILRRGIEKEISIKPLKYCDRVIPKLYDKSPSMLMIGGLVFTPLSLSYLEECNDGGSTPTGLSVEYGKPKSSIDEEVVILTEILGDEVNLGYQSYSNIILEEVNGKKILNMKDLSEVIETMNEGFMTFRFKDKIQIVLDIKKMKESMNRIMDNYGLSSSKSKDLEIKDYHNSQMQK